jgi:chorismate mutase
MMETEGALPRLAALRGATRARNEETDIRKQTAALYDALLLANGLDESSLVSLCFSVTEDLDALNPAAALRQSGRAGDLALMVFQEARFVNSLPGTIRALLHCYLPAGRTPRHIYRNGAEILRPDRAGVLDEANNA